MSILTGVIKYPKDKNVVQYGPWLLKWTCVTCSVHW